MRSWGKRLQVAFGEGCLSGALAAAVTMAGLSLALDDLQFRHTRTVAPIFLLIVSPFLGAAIARIVLPTSGGVNIAWLGSACFAGFVIGSLTLPWRFWSSEPVAYQNAIWVATSVTVAACAAAMWSRWRASRPAGRRSVTALVKLEQKLDSASGRIVVAVVRGVWIGLNTAVFLVAAWSYRMAPDDTNWGALLGLTFVVLLFPGGFLTLFALLIATEILPVSVEGYTFAVLFFGLWAGGGAISYRFWFVWIPRAVRLKRAGLASGIE